MKAIATRFAIFWKGREVGRYTPEEIQGKLDHGEISLMHQVMHQGRWISVGELLADLSKAKEQRDINARQRTAQVVAEKRETEEKLAIEARRDEEVRLMQQRFEQQLAEERSKQQELAEKLRALETRMQTPPAAVSPPPPPPSHFGRSGQWQGEAYVQPRRTCGLAIAALVMGVLNFIPFVNFVSWILALVFGHVALSRIDRDPTLEGRGLAIAGLVITYALLALGGLFLLVTFLQYSKIIK